jgi:hypothetical protein
MTVFPIEQVPVELQKRIAGFLTHYDAYQFSESTTQIHESLGMSTIVLPDPLITEMSWTGAVVGGDTPRRYLTIPLMVKNRIHTVMLQGRFKDQGWGNQKGCLYIVATSSSGSRIVVETPLASHTNSRFSLKFSIADDETYSLWYKVGAGGGHALSVYNLRLQIIIFDGRGRHLEKNFSAMVQRGALRGFETDFHFHMLQTISRTLLLQLERGDSPDINMSTFFESSGIEVSKQSLLALDQIATSLMELGNLAVNEDGEETKEEVRVRQQLFAAAVVQNVPAENNNDNDNNRRANNEEEDDGIDEEDEEDVAMEMFDDGIFGEDDMVRRIQMGPFAARRVYQGRPPRGRPLRWRGRGGGRPGPRGGGGWDVR